MPTPADNEPQLVSYEDRRISVRTQVIENGRYAVAALGVWSESGGRHGYTKLAPPAGEFQSRPEAYAAGVTAGQLAIDQGLA
jgi:hypothetical protein